jgi:hypothetical protein
MQPNIPVSPRRWERALATIPIRLVLKPENFKADDSATTVDVSLRGAKVETSLALVPGEWVGVIPRENSLMLFLRGLFGCGRMNPAISRLRGLSSSRQMEA